MPQPSPLPSVVTPTPPARLTTVRAWLQRLMPLLVLALLGLAAWVLYEATRVYSFHDVLRHMADLRRRDIVVAVLLTVLSYWVLTGYDLLGLAYVGRALEYGRVALASFVGYVFSYNVGLSIFGSGAIRYRFYFGWGLAPGEIGRLVGFAAVTFWLGLLSLAGVVLVAQPLAIPALLHVSFESSRPLGAALLVPVAGYLGWALVWRRPARLRGLRVEPPRRRIVLGQLVVSVADNAIAAGVLYALLPPSDLGYPAFAGVYLLGVAAGLVSHVPGGLGVFESVVLLLLSPAYFTAPQILSALVAYRIIYYFIPFAIGASMLGTYELARHTSALPRAGRVFGRVVPQLTPRFLTLSTFAAGVILLLSGAAPTAHWRLRWLHDFLPLPLIEASHILASVAGVLLLVLARGIQRRIDAAWGATLVMLGVGIVVSLGKGGGYEEALALALMALALAPSRRYFYRKASLLAQPFTLGWVVAVAVAIGGSLWLGFFSYRHVEYSSDLWWHFAVRADAPRFMRASVAAVAVAVALAVARLLAPGRRRPPPPTAADLERATAIAVRSPETLAQLVTLGDKQILLEDGADAFLMYGVEGRSWVALGDPVGDEAAFGDLAWRLRELADTYGGWAVFYEVSPDYLPIYLDLGLTLLKLGEEARVELEGFTLDGQRKRDLRHALRRLETAGCRFDIVEPAGVPPLLDRLEAISRSWLQAKHTREKGFSLGFFDRAYLSRTPVAIVVQGGEPIAFANVWRSGGKEELSIDLMRHDRAAPRGVMDFLLTNIVLWGKAEGYRWFNLGMAPFSGMEARATAPAWNRLGAALFRFGEYFYNFQGLRQYKEKFEPVWRPRYVASPGRVVLPLVMANVAALVSRGLRGVVAR